jgi:ankyrin repeat protein
MAKRQNEGMSGGEYVPAGDVQQPRSANLRDYLEHMRKTSWHFENSDFKDLDARDDEGESLLHKAVIMDEPEIVKELVELGVELNFHGDLGYTPLHCAVIFQFLAIVTILVEARADIDSLDEGKMTPLHLAAMGKKLEIVEFLVERGADLDRKDMAGRMPIDFADPDSPIFLFLQEEMAKRERK